MDLHECRQCLCVIHDMVSYQISQEKDLEGAFLSDDAMAATILKELTVAITHKVNLSSLMPYLIQNDCIHPEDAQQQFPKTATRGDNNLKLIDIIRSRGVSAFNGFMKALAHFTADEPGEGAHRELLDSLKQKAKMSKYARRSTVSSLKSQDSKSSLKSDPRTSISSTVPRCMSIPEESIVGPVMSVGPDIVEPDMPAPAQVDNPRTAGDTSTLVSVNNYHVNIFIFH